MSGVLGEGGDVPGATLPGDQDEPGLRGVERAPTRAVIARLFGRVPSGERLRLRVALRGGANGAAQRLQTALAQRLRDAGVAQPAIDVEVVERLERSARGEAPPRRRRTGPARRRNGVMSA
jgi:hypothetical protein